MEHDFDLHVPKAETKNRSGKINCKYLRRFIAMLLSVVLTAGACLPAMAAEQQEAQTEEAGGNLLNTQGDASWLDDYTYYTTDLDEWTTAICLEHYNGTETEIEVPGTVEIQSVTYSVTAKDGGVWGNSIESFTFGAGFIFPEDCSYFFEGKDALTSVDMSLADTSRVTDIEGMFAGCGDLSYINLGGWDWSQIQYYPTDLIEDCPNLEELISPEYLSGNKNPVYLPCLMANQNGEILDCLPVESESVTLTAVELPGWLDDYDYSFDKEYKEFVLENYHGASTEITMHAGVTIAGTEYDVKVDSCPWKAGVTSLSFEGSDPLRYVDSNFFGAMQDLEVLDLRNVNCTTQNYQSFGSCANLKTIFIPANCSWGSALPRLFKDENGNTYSYLPTDIPNSIRLDAVIYDAWLGDFVYQDNDSKLKLIGYNGDQADLVVPGHAAIDGAAYDEVWIQSNIWQNSSVKSLKFENGVKFGQSTSGGIEIHNLFDELENLESADFSEVSANGFVTVQSMFEGCTNLKNVDLSGFDFSNCQSAEKVFDGCDSLETIETPVNVHCSLALPVSFSDEDGNIYTEMPKNLSESITLTRTNGSGDPSESGDPSGTCEHVYGEWIVTKAATCTEAGSREKTCTRCGNKVIEEIPAAGHKWNSDYTVDRKPTGTAEGSRSKHCSVCNAINPSTVQSIPRLTGTWKKDSKGWWYSWSDGSYSKNKFENFGGKVYYFNSSGYMVTGWQAIGGKWYYFDADGVMKTGWQSIGGKWYYMNGSGVMVTGWQSIGGKWYYMNGSGAMVTGWQSIGGKWYYFDGNGAMKTGWQSIGRKWYYFDGSGAMKTGWQSIGGKWYYMNGSGVMQTGWQAIGGKWYYFDGSGAMKTGWQYIGDKWYYFDGSGAMKTGWLSIGGTWYYMNGSGVMQTGWQSIGGKWYYFDGSGVMAADKWVGNYYLTGSGAMAANTWIGNYYVGSDGKWIPGYGK